MQELLMSLKGKEYDCLCFLPGDEEGEVKIDLGEYEDRGSKIGGSKMGDAYYITLIREKPCGDIDFDTFEAILSDPLVYISNLIPAGFFGIISKKTSTSMEFNDDMTQKIKECFVN